MRRKLSIDRKDLEHLVWWARRYCDGRSTFAPSSFNDVYKRILQQYPDLEEDVAVDQTLSFNSEFYPLAQDGMYNPETKCFDATR